MNKKHLIEENYIFKKSIHYYDMLFQLLFNLLSLKDNS